jgi:hypothetical protein
VRPLELADADFCCLVILIRIDIDVVLRVLFPEERARVLSLESAGEGEEMGKKWGRNAAMGTHHAPLGRWLLLVGLRGGLELLSGFVRHGVLA